jgi:hypothetical protein
VAGDDGPGLADITHVQGVYTLTATTRNHTAHVPPPERQDTAGTSFTGELRDLIHAGIPGVPSPLTLGDIYPVLHDRLRAKGLPVPNQRGTDTAGQFPFAANFAAPGSSAARAHRQQDSDGLTVQTGPTPTAVRTARLLDDAIRTAQSIPEKMGWAWYAAHGFAGAVVALDPDRAKPFLKDRERYIRSILMNSRNDAQSVDEHLNYLDILKGALANVAVMATVDPARAEHLAQSIIDRHYKASALVDVVKKLDPRSVSRHADRKHQGQGSARSSRPRGPAADRPDDHIGHLWSDRKTGSGAHCVKGGLIVSSG